MFGGFLFQIHWGFPVEGRVFAARIVETVDVFEEGDFDLAACLPVSAPDQLCLQRLEQAFDGRVGITVPLSAH